MLRKFVLLAAVLLLALPHANADEASKRAKIDQLFLAMHMDTTMQQMLKVGMSQGEAMAHTVFGGKPPSASDQKILDDYSSKVYALMNETLSWDKLKPAYSDLYASAYTEEDIEVMLAFYKTPTGQKMVSTMAELSTKSIQIVTARMQEVQPKLQALITELMEKVKAAHPDATPNP